MWVPARKVVCTGDLFIWASPNCGNPQKAQRYAIEWSRALDEMAALGAEVLLPGHGLPIVGADRVHQALTDSARLLEHLHVETIRMMNEGRASTTSSTPSPHRPSSSNGPTSGRSTTSPSSSSATSGASSAAGTTGTPRTLKPAPEAAVAAELAGLAGGADKLAARAVALADAGDLRLAGHLAEMAALAAPDDPAVHGARAEVFERRVEAEASTMAKGIFGWAASESRERAGDPPS